MEIENTDIVDDLNRLANQASRLEPFGEYEAFDLRRAATAIARVRSDLAAARAECARLRAERDKLIAAWPCNLKGTVYHYREYQIDCWLIEGDEDDPRFQSDTREAAVRHAAGLDADAGKSESH